MGPMSRGERTVAVVFVLTAALWIFRPLVAEAVPGLNDTTIAMAGVRTICQVNSDEGNEIMECLSPSGCQVKWRRAGISGCGRWQAIALSGNLHSCNVSRLLERQNNSKLHEIKPEVAIFGESDKGVLQESYFP